MKGNEAQVAHLQIGLATTKDANPQQVQKDAERNIAVTGQAMKDVRTAVSEQAKTANGATPGGPSFGGRVAGAALETAAVMGAAMVADVAAPGAGTLVAGAGTFSTFNDAMKEFRTHAPGKNGGRGMSSGYQSSPAQHSLDIMSGQGYTNVAAAKMSQGPGFGRAPVDMGRIQLAEDSLSGIRIGNMHLPQYMKALQQIERDSTVALGQKLERDEAGLAATPQNLDRMLAKGMTRLDPRFV